MFLVVVAVAFLIVLVSISLAGVQVPCGSRGLIVFLLALVAASAGAAWGGSLAAHGYIPIPNIGTPLVVGTAGGVGVFIVVIALGFATYADCDDPPKIWIANVSVGGPTPTEQLIGNVTLGSDKSTSGYTARVVVAEDPSLKKRLYISAAVAASANNTISVDLPVDKQTKLLGDRYFGVELIDRNGTIVATAVAEQPVSVSKP